MSTDSKKKDDNPELYNMTGVFWICISALGPMYSLAETASLHDNFKEYFQKDYSEQFEFYYALSQTIAFAALIVLSIFVGVLCDLYSNSIVTLISVFIMLIGQFCVYVSIYFENFWFYFIGRTIICLTSPIFITCSNLYAVYVAPSTKQGLANGLYSSSKLMSKFLNLIIDPPTTKYLGLLNSTLITFLLCGVSFIACFFCYQIEDKIRKYQLVIENQKLVVVKEDSSKQQIIDEDEQIKEQQLQLQNSQQNQQQTQLQQILNFDRKYWLYAFILSLCILLSNSIDFLLPAYISSEWKLDVLTATKISSICTFFGLFVWLIGILLDYTSNYYYEWMIFIQIAFTTGFFILISTSPIIGSIFIGLGYNFRVGLMMPLLNKIVKKESMGKAFGLIRSLKDVLATIFFMYVSFSVKSTNSYQDTFKTLTYLSCFMTFLCFILCTMKNKKY